MFITCSLFVFSVNVPGTNTDVSVAVGSEERKVLGEQERPSGLGTAGGILPSSSDPLTGA